MKTKLTGLALATMMAVAPSAQAGEVEVLHYWTSGGEAASVAFLKEQLAASGVDWVDFAVAGGAGESAMTVLKSRAISGNPPTAAQIKGPSIQDWGELGFLTSIDDVAKANNWDQILPEVVSDVMKYEGEYVAAPVNVHRVNWLWANPEVFRKAGATVPTTWDDFMVQAQKLKDAGYIALAHGGQAWQDATVFEAVVLGVGGADYYNKAFVQADMDALNSATTKKVFETFGQLRQFVDINSPGRDWNLATSMVINGEAGMQIMGDWAQGEFAVAGQVAGTDYSCLPGLGVTELLSTGGDAFYFPVLSDEAEIAAQSELAALMLRPATQVAFNLAKGSLPVRGDIDLSTANDCMQKGLALLADGALLPDTNQLVTPDTAEQISTLFVEFFADPSITVEDAQARFANIIAIAE